MFCEPDKMAEHDVFTELRFQTFFLSLEYDCVPDDRREIAELGEAVVDELELFVKQLVVNKRKMALREGGLIEHEQVELNTDAQEDPIFEGKVAEERFP